MPIRELNWEQFTGQTIRIYRNLNNGAMSIQAKDGKSWKVVGHVTAAIVANVTFKIQEGGRQRVIKEGRKNVHAWGQGVLLGQANDDIWTPIALGYDPYNNSTFVQRGTGNIISQCSYLVVRNNLVFVSPDAVSSVTPSNQKPQSFRNSVSIFSEFNFAFAA